MWGGVGYGPDKGLQAREMAGANLAHGAQVIIPFMHSRRFTLQTIPGIWAAHCECKFKISLPCQVTHQSYPSSDNNVDIFVQCEF